MLFISFPQFVVRVSYLSPSFIPSQYCIVRGLLCLFCANKGFRPYPTCFSFWPDTSNEGTLFWVPRLHSKIRYQCITQTNMLMKIQLVTRLMELFSFPFLLRDYQIGIWGLVNNAGIAITGPIEWMPLQKSKRIANVNLWGLIDVTKTFLPLVKKTRGRVVNMSSMLGESLHLFLYPNKIRLISPSFKCYWDLDGVIPYWFRHCVHAFGGEGPVFF